MKIVQEIVNKLSRIESILEVSMIGSRAKNCHEVDSDYDLCIILKSQENRERILESLADIMMNKKVIIHPYIYTEDEYKFRFSLNIFNNMFTDKIIIWEP